MRRLLVLVALLAAVAVPAARADGDPASDYLYTQHVFLPFDVKAAQPKQRALLSTVENATRAGFPIRVAVIGSPYDLGAVPSLWRKPRVYAKFLGAELQFVYKQRLLVVMPNGFGLYWNGRRVTHEYAVLAPLKIAPGAGGLADGARHAVAVLSADAGVRVEAEAAPKSTANRDRLVVLVASIAVIALALGVRFALRRRGQRA